MHGQRGLQPPTRSPRRSMKRSKGGALRVSRAARLQVNCRLFAVDMRDRDMTPPKEPRRDDATRLTSCPTGPAPRQEWGASGVGFWGC